MIKRTRSSNLELLRILLMLMIVCYHAVLYGGLMGCADGSAAKNTALLFNIGGQLGVSGFVLITGYFLSKTAFKLSRIVRLVLKAIFYTVAVYLALCACGVVGFDGAYFTMRFFPILTSRYWFLTAYVLVAALSPALNLVLEHAAKRLLQIYLILGPVVLQLVPLLVDKNPYYSSTLWFVYLYCLGGYIRRYPLGVLENKWAALGLFASMTALIWCVSLYFSGLPADAPNYIYSTYFADLRSFPLLLSALGLFMFFKNLRMKNYKLVNLIGGTTLGVYVLHEHDQMRDFLWGSLCNLTGRADGPAVWLWILLAGAAVFFVCAAIDLAVQYTLGKLADRTVNPLCDRVQSAAGGKPTSITVVRD